MKDKKILIKIGSAIRKLRLEKGISQENLAKISNLDRTYVGGIERGERNVSVLALEKLSDALGVSVRDFFRF